jgi:hypothetical protein
MYASLCFLPIYSPGLWQRQLDGELTPGGIEKKMNPVTLPHFAKFFSLQISRLFTK